MNQLEKCCEPTFYSTNQLEKCCESTFHSTNQLEKCCESTFYSTNQLEKCYESTFYSTNQLEKCCESTFYSTNQLEKCCESTFYSIPVTRACDASSPGVPFNYQRQKKIWQFLLTVSVGPVAGREDGVTEEAVVVGDRLLWHVASAINLTNVSHLVENSHNWHLGRKKETITAATCLSPHPSIHSLCS